MTDRRRTFSRRTLCTAVLVISAATIAASSADARPQKDLVGTWRLVSFEDVGDGKTWTRVLERVGR